ncbi:MAG: SDR family oxidoreductase [Rubinisphaera brasiliensis]|uniref:SDR family oxidoreductase n=1 Tax=Rubinisphaera brasiliensis TaxID=119 RepID=UPI003918C869
MTRILLTGATGYVGGRLLPLLESAGYHVSCMSRNPKRLSGRTGPNTQVVTGDVHDRDSLLQAMQGIDVAFYFVHAMGDDEDFEEREKTAAENFASAADEAGVKRIIYLGGLGDESRQLSKHLRSRHETGRILRQSKALTIEFRASIVIGSGSLSFELIRALVQRLPVMICPKWVNVRAQPIAIEDLLSYLIAAVEVDLDESMVFEIGGPDQVSYGELMNEYARQRQLTRLMIPVPLLTPYLSSLWLGLVTPLYARVGRKIVTSMKNTTLVTNDLAREHFEIEPRGVSDAIARALVNEEHEFAVTRWSDALSAGGPQPSWGGVRFGNRLVDSRTIQVDVPRDIAFLPIQRIGGDTGWYFGNWLWQLRGFLDLLVGGVGVRRGRRHPEELRVGDALDFWRVEKIIPGHELLLRAEMKVPGRAWLEFETTEIDDNRTEIRQTALFDPKGLFGLAYWYALYPLHQIVFYQMLRNIGKAAEETASKQPDAPPLNVSSGDDF